MSTVAVLNIEGKEVGQRVLLDSVFAIEPNLPVLHMCVVNHLANCRQGTQSTLTRTEVRGGGRKPWRQKGTGHARQGSTRSPQWVHGGVALGPKPRSYRFSLNKKVKKLAMRSALSSKLAVELANEAGARLHIAHISTARELALLSNEPLEQKRITGEVCISHLMFNDSDYHTLGARVKCNPAVKTKADQQALQEALQSSLIDTVATDHAPHLLSEKQGGALKAMSGMPTIQFSLNCMLELVDKGVISIEALVQKMCHNPALLYHIKQRGFIRPGYQADLVLVRPNSPFTVNNEILQSKCGWSPLEGHQFNWQVARTFVNGNQVYLDGNIIDNYKGQPLNF